VPRAGAAQFARSLEASIKPDNASRESY
jgi:hypothetical protein